jgi:sugar/nucleoside kinase (ribokinase family)
MSRTPRYFGLDTVMVDMVLRIEQLPEPGGDAVVSERLVTAGGGFNAMSAAVRQGMGVTYVGQLGTGPFADIARECLEYEGIGLPVESREGVDLGVCIVLVEANGERSFVTSPGAEGTVSAQELSGVEVRDGDYVSFSGYNFVYPGMCAEMLAWLRTLSPGVLVAFDPGPRVLDINASVLHEVLERTDWLLCNETEAMALTRAASPDDAVHHLTGANPRRGVVVRCGRRGCIVARAGAEPIEIAGVETTVVDTNGAGDVHNGVFLAELARGTELHEAIARANIAAAVAISVLGPATSPTRDVVSQRLTALAN